MKIDQDIQLHYVKCFRPVIMHSCGNVIVKFQVKDDLERFRYMNMVELDYHALKFTKAFWLFVTISITTFSHYLMAFMAWQISQRPSRTEASISTFPCLSFCIVVTLCTSHWN